MSRPGGNTHKRQAEDAGAEFTALGENPAALKTYCQRDLSCQPGTWGRMC
jgi:hypothetical protein